MHDIREKINHVDEQLIELFRERMDLASQIAAYKRERNLPVLDKRREREILQKVAQMAGEPLDVYAQVLYSVLFDLSRSYQTSLLEEEAPLIREIRQAAENSPKLFPRKGTVACQGVEGAYSQLACDRLFGMPNILYFKNFEGVFQAVEQGLCDFGVLPVDNSSYGTVNAVYDLMRHYKFHIVRSIKLHIDHNLLAKPGVRLEDIKEIFSHEQAIGQCSKFLSSLKGVKVTVCANTAAAAKMVSESSRTDVAAISSHNCAQLYNLQALSGDIQNSANNYTRFICIAKDLTIYSGANKISLMFSLSHEPGSLYGMIAPFAALGVNLTKLESRPILGRDFEFMFYFDLESSVWSEDILKLLSDLSSRAEQFVFLGSYSEI